MNKTKSYDVIIAGGGFVGMTLALALGQTAPKGFRVVLVDTERPSDTKVDARASALSAASKSLLSVLGVWPELAGNSEAIASIEIAVVTSLASVGHSVAAAEQLASRRRHRRVAHLPLGAILVGLAGANISHAVTVSARALPIVLAVGSVFDETARVTAVAGSRVPIVATLARVERVVATVGR